MQFPKAMSRWGKTLCQCRRVKITHAKITLYTVFDLNHRISNYLLIIFFFHLNTLYKAFINVNFYFRVQILTTEPKDCGRSPTNLCQAERLRFSLPMPPATTMEPLWKTDKSQRSFSTHRIKSSGRDWSCVIVSVMCDNSEELWWQLTSNWACDEESVYLLLCFELWYVIVLTMDWCILNVAIDSIYVLKTDIFNQSFVFLLLQDLQFDISQAKRYFSSFSKIVIHVYTGMFIHVYVKKKKSG